MFANHYPNVDMKQLVPFFLFCLALHPLVAQRVENVRSEQRGDLIYVYYDLIGSDCCEEFDVLLFADFDQCGDRDNLQLREVSGDVGTNVRAGRDRKIVWDVLEEVDRLGSVQFSVRAYPLRTAPKPRYTYEEPPRHDPHPQVKVAPAPPPREVPEVHEPKKKARQKSTGIFMAYNASERMPYGGRIGRLSGLGSYMAVRVGEGAPGEEALFTTGSFIVGPTVRIVKSRAFKMYLYGGVGIGRWYINSRNDGRDYYHQFATAPELEWGAIMTLGRLTFTGGVSTLRDYHSEANFGIGLTFGSRYR